eukprot:CAMPEP_0119539704 /NCGR_PEP_ID=MMETSP1344-20130328/51791_1 /TAXON_ID=236787 /ORGANISM="Florenciella parvula, Strain CCMP2471" /LENGTH=74 /DNA_ID=CAMNT_0007583121 /DNA_START=97 /DNA_END=318 /DNA_ORIENTATION=+
MRAEVAAALKDGPHRREVGAMPTHGGPVARAPSNDPHAHATHAPESHLAQLPPEVKITQVSQRRAPATVGVVVR